MTIPEVAIRSGHKTWDNLRRYTHLIHRNPPDFWANCKRIEQEYWGANRVENQVLKRHSSESPSDIAPAAL